MSAFGEIADIASRFSNCSRGHKSFVGTFWGATPTGLYAIVRTGVFFRKGGHSLRQI
jgi:hypothetical protein